MQSTIWGVAQQVGNLVRGVRFVSTARHGGLLLAPGYARRYLPDKVRKAMPFEYGYVHMEEDCDCVLALLFDHRLIVASWPSLSESDDELNKRLASVVRTVRQWHGSLIDEDLLMVHATETDWSAVRASVVRR